MIQPQHLTHNKSLKKGLQHGYTFDETQGSVLNDIVSGNNLIIPANNVLFNQEGVVGKSIRFLSQKVNSVVSQDDILLSENFSISFWLKINVNKSAGWYFTFREAWGAAANNVLQIIQYNSTDLRFGIWNASGIASADVIIKGEDINFTKFYNIVITSKNGMFKIFLDSSLVCDLGYIEFSSNQKLRLGNNITQQHPINANFDELYIWNRALSEEEITRLYNNGNGLTYTDF